MKVIFLVVTAFLLTSCAEYKWVKLANNDFDMGKVYTACSAKALIDLLQIIWFIKLILILRVMIIRSIVTNIFMEIISSRLALV